MTGNGPDIRALLLAVLDRQIAVTQKTDQEAAMWALAELKTLELAVQHAVNVGSQHVEALSRREPVEVRR